MKQDDITSLLGVTTQMINIMKDQNVQASLALLGPQDVLISPELGNYSAADFDHLESLVPLGEAATRAVAAKLAKYALPPDQYAALRARQVATLAPDRRVVDAIRFEGLERANAKVLAASMDTKVGAAIDPTVLDNDIRRLYGQGDFEHIGYHLFEEQGQHVLSVEALEKSWGPDYVRFGLALVTDFQSEAYFDVGASYRRHWLNWLGAEARVDAQLGYVTRIAGELYQPLDPAGRFFVAPYALAERRPLDLYSGQDRIARFIVATNAVGLDLGMTFGRWGEARAGVAHRLERTSLDTGLPIFDNDHVEQQVVRGRFQFDQLDNLDFHAPWHCVRFFAAQCRVKAATPAPTPNIRWKPRLPTPSDRTRFSSLPRRRARSPASCLLSTSSSSAASCSCRGIAPDSFSRRSSRSAEWCISTGCASSRLFRRGAMYLGASAGWDASITSPSRARQAGLLTRRLGFPRGGYAHWPALPRLRPRQRKQQQRLSVSRATLVRLLVAGRRSLACARTYPPNTANAPPRLICRVVPSPLQSTLMAQYVFTMNRVGKIVPPKRQILKDISLSFFPGAKIGVLGLNGSGKSTVLKIMAGIDKEIIGEATPMPNLNIGYLPQEPEMDASKSVREIVETGLSDVLEAQRKLEDVYTAYAEEGADFEALANEQARLEAIINAGSGHDTELQLEIAADALRLPPWDAKVAQLSGGEKRRVALCRLLLSKPDMLLLDEAHQSP